jgi:hypothetical protein
MSEGGKEAVRADEDVVACVYRQLKRGRSDDEVRPGSRVN